MKSLTPEEVDEHYRETLKGGTLAGAAGLLSATLATRVLSSRYGGFRTLTTPMKAFLATSVGTFAAIIGADRASRSYELRRRPAAIRASTSSERQVAELDQAKSSSDKAISWMFDHRYELVGASWVAGMLGSWAVVRRKSWLTTSQKIVQARVAAQGITVAVLLALFGFESVTGARVGEWETIVVREDGRDVVKRIHHEKYAGEDQWIDMVAAAEREAKSRPKATDS